MGTSARPDLSEIIHDPMRRWREERDEKNRQRSDVAAESGQRLSAASAMVDEGFRTATQPERDPFFHASVAETPPPSPAPERPLGPGPAGMRPSRRAPPPEEADPYAQESALGRTLARIRYQSPLTPFFGLGQTEAKVLHTLVQRPLAWGEEKLGVENGPFRGAEQLLDERIKADEARENVVRTRYMAPAERVGHDLARFGAEFSVAGAMPGAGLLRAAPMAVRAGEGAGLLARAGAGAARVGVRGATEAGKFGAFEAGKSLATGEGVDAASHHAGEGMLAGAILGGGFGAVGEALPIAGRILRPVAEGAAAIPGAVRGVAQQTARDLLVTDAMVRETAGGVRRRITNLFDRTRGAPDYAALAAEGRDLTLVKKMTPKAKARYAEIREQMKGQPPIEGTPPLEESAAAPGVHDAQLHEISERLLAQERRREQVPVETERRAPAAPEAPAGAPTSPSRAPEPRTAEAGARVPPEGAIVPPAGSQRVEPGVPRDHAAVQEGIFGEKTLVGQEQTELLPPTAGVPTPGIKGTKITAEEVGRVRREGGEPAGEKPGELLPERSRKFAKLDDTALEARYRQILDRMSAKGTEAGEGVNPWTRFDDDIQAQRSGTSVTGKAGRAIGRLKDDGRIAAEIEAEFAARGIDREHVITRYMEEAPERQGLQEEAGDISFPLRVREQGRHPFDVSRHRQGGPDITKAELPEEFHTEKWEPGKSPDPADLRRQTAWPGTANRTMRRMESAIETATKEADRLDGAKDVEGARAARETATQLAARKEALHQQAERAIAHAERERAVPPETVKRGTETATVMGMRVREPTTARTPLEPNYEVPLATKTSEALPDAAVPNMKGPEEGGGLTAPARSEIIKKMSAALNLPTRIGKMKQKALGIYKVTPEVVRLKVAKQLEEAAHEFGHHIHKLFFGKTPRGGLSSKVLRPWHDELLPLAKGISDETAAEGWSEFFRRYLNNPKAAEDAAPKLLAYVEGRIAKEFPEVGHMRDEARPLIKLYNAATPEARFASNISTKPTQHWSFAEQYRRFLTNVIDDIAVIEGAQRDIVSSALDLSAPSPWRPYARARWLSEVRRQTGWEESASELARLFRGSLGQAEHWMKIGSLDYATLKVKGKSLEAILRPITKQFDEFTHYAVARRAIELHGRKIETGFRPEDATWVRDKHHEREHFQRAFADLQTYQRHLLEYMRDAGVLSHETFERILKSNDDYLPFYRVLDDELGRRYGGGGLFGRIFSPIKRIRGSGLDVINPFESIIKNTYLHVRLAARQRVANALAQWIKRDGAGPWIERLVTPTKAVQLPLDEVVMALEKMGVEVGGLSEDTAREMLTFYRPGDYFGKENIISVLENGERAWYEVKPELYETLMGLGKEEVEAATKLLAYPARALRVGATLAPEFPPRNFARDQVAAFVQSEYGFKPGVDWARGLFHLLSKDEVYRTWIASGAARAALLSLDRNSQRTALKAALGHAPEGTALLKDVIKSPIELLRVLSEYAEDATRVGEYARGLRSQAKEQGLLTTPWYQPIDAAREAAGKLGREEFERAALSSREVSVDFARHGAKTASVRLVTAFWNARLQGYDRLRRAFRDHPIRSSVRAGVGITFPSVLLFYVNKDNADYWKKPQWERDLFWHIPHGKDEAGETRFLKVPKPYELGMVFGTIPERILEWHYSHDPKGLSESLKGLALDFTLGMLPILTVALPLVENLWNWSTFRQRPIVSRALEGVERPFQFTSGTSEVSKGMGRMLGLSPLQIENTLFGWTGGLGRLATDVGDAAGEQVGLFPKEPRPSKTAADIPGVRGFVSRPAGQNSEDVERFYSAWSDAQRAKSTRDLLHREDRLDELDTFEDKNADVLDRYDDLKGYADEMAKLRHEIAEVGRDETLTPDQRRQEVEALGREMQQIAQEAIERKTPANMGQP